VSRQAALIVRIEVEVLDDTWDDDTLQGNAACYLESIIHDAEKSRHHPEADAYRLDHDCTVWTEANFALELADLAEGRC
jgi:hypothetical protein